MNFEKASAAAREAKNKNPGLIVSAVEKDGVFMVFAQQTRRTVNDYSRKGWTTYELTGGELRKYSRSA